MNHLKTPQMTSSPPRLEIYNSPKRKRGAHESVEHSSDGSPRISPKHKDVKEGSERPEDGSRVTGQLQTLDLQGTFVRQISFTDAAHAKKRFAQAGKEHALQPVIDEFFHKARCAADPAQNDLLTNVSLDPERFTSSSSITDRPCAHGRSPPIDWYPDDSSMTWHESEITGHKPTDPNDDGYGINGIGFKPTPAIAWARSQKRKQQLAEYRNREAREARQQRSERRTRGSAEIPAEIAEVTKERIPKVRFGDVD